MILILIFQKAIRNMLEGLKMVEIVNANCCIQISFTTINCTADIEIVYTTPTYLKWFNSFVIT